MQNVRGVWLGPRGARSRFPLFPRTLRLASQELAYSLLAQAGDSGDHLAAGALCVSQTDQPMELDSRLGETGLQACDVLGRAGELIQRVLEWAQDDLALARQCAFMDKRLHEIVARTLRL